MPRLREGESLDIHLIGSMPPPYGGVSVHIARLRQRLLAEGHSCTVWCDREDRDGGLARMGSTPRAIQSLTRLEGPVILHFHSAYLIAGLLAAANRRVVATFHDHRLERLTHGGRFPREWLSRRLTGRSLRRLPQAIAVSDRTRQALLQEGLPSDSIAVVNAYLPPMDSEKAHPRNLEALAPFRRRHAVLATANAWAPRFFEGVDLYGLDLCLDMLDRLRDRVAQLGLVLVVPSAQGSEYISHLRALTRQKGLSDRVLWLTESGAYHPILRECDIFLRPTNTDGFAISIVEAFEYGVPVVASDAVVRPQGCLTFCTRDLHDFCSKVEEVIGNWQYWSDQGRAAAEPDRFADIVGLYRRLVARER